MHVNGDSGFSSSLSALFSTQFATMSKLAGSDERRLSETQQFCGLI